LDELHLGVFEGLLGILVAFTSFSKPQGLV